MGRRQGYDGIAVCVPVTIPYSRYSERSAHWFCGRALAQLIAGAGIAKGEIHSGAVDLHGRGSVFRYGLDLETCRQGA